MRSFWPYSAKLMVRSSAIAEIIILSDAVSTLYINVRIPHMQRIDVQFQLYDQIQNLKYILSVA